MTTVEPTVHIVDDDAQFRAAVSRLLRANGFAVKTFASASDFLAQEVEHAPGCVLADVQMPGMNGLELQSAIARSAKGAPPTRARAETVARDKIATAMVTARTIS